jgi:ornithine cyclodeaminase
MSAPFFLNWDDISLLLGQVEVHDSMKQAFIEYSKGNAEIPPVGELLFEDPPGEVHIKYGYLKGGSHYVIKIASGFPNNEEKGIKPGQGMMLLFNINTGLPQAIFVDEANLTDLRTGIAGAIASQTLANSDLEVATIIGSGVQARYQARCHVDLMPLNSLMIWARDYKKAEVLMDDLSDLNITIKIHNDLEALVKESQLIVTATSAKTPIIKSDWVRPGTHITAVGSDTPEKCELDPKLLAKASIVVADSISQNKLRGEIYQALKESCLSAENLIELGEVLEGTKLGRTGPNQITVADLTGVAIQDLVIAEAVYRAKISN